MSTLIFLKKDFNYMGSTKKQSNGKKINVAMKKAILFFGGTVALSKQLDVDNSTVSKWLYEKRPIPLKYAVKIEKLTKGEIKFKDLRYDVFED